MAELLRRLEQIVSGQRIVASAVTMAELVQGIYQGAPERSQKRRTFVDDLGSVLRVVPFTSDTAWIAGRLRGEQAAAGNMLPFADSLIAATALEIGYSVITQNESDFTRIPGLTVLSFSL